MHIRKRRSRAQNPICTEEPNSPCFHHHRWFCCWLSSSLLSKWLSLFHQRLILFHQRLIHQNRFRLSILRDPRMRSPRLTICEPSPLFLAGSTAGFFDVIQICMIIYELGFQILCFLYCIARMLQRRHWFIVIRQLQVDSLPSWHQNKLNKSQVCIFFLISDWNAFIG